RVSRASLSTPSRFKEPASAAVSAAPFSPPQTIERQECLGLGTVWGAPATVAGSFGVSTSAFATAAESNSPHGWEPHNICCDKRVTEPSGEMIPENPLTDGKCSNGWATAPVADWALWEH